MRSARTSAPAVSLPWSVFSLVLSLLAHLAVASPALVWLLVFADPPMETPGEEGEEDGPVGDDGGEVAEGVADPEPMAVSIYVEPVAAPPTEITEAPIPGAPPTAVAEVSPSPIEGTKEGDPNTTTISPAEKAGLKGRRPRGNRKPCEPIEEIVNMAEFRWRVERDVVDYYAAHLRELQKHVAVSTHLDGGGTPDGVRLYLPRCSILRQAGMKHGDIIHTVNGRRVATLTDGIAAYLFLRNEDSLELDITRKNGDRLRHRYRIRP